MDQCHHMDLTAWERPRTCLCTQEEPSGCVSLCIHQVSSLTSDDVTQQPLKSLSLHRRSPYAVQSLLGLLFVGMF